MQIGKTGKSTLIKRIYIGNGKMPLANSKISVYRKVKS